MPLIGRGGEKSADGLSELARRFATRAAVVAVALAVVVAAVVLYVARSPGGLRITAEFTRAIGINPGDHVDILGLPVGQIDSIEPAGPVVKVVMTLPAGTRVPADAQAVIVPPSVISNRYVDLTPVYRGGPLLRDGAVIPSSRSLAPAEYDDLVDSIDRLSSALGPNSGAPQGALGDALHQLAANLRGNGQQLQATITALADAGDTVAGTSGALADLLSALDGLTHALADHSSLIASFQQDLAAATTELNNQRTAIQQSVVYLSQAFGGLNQVLAAHRQDISTTVHGLADVTSSLLTQERSLIEALDVLPLALDNITRAEKGGQVQIRLTPGQQHDQLCALLPQLCQTVPGLPSLPGLPPIPGVTSGTSGSPAQTLPTIPGVPATSGGSSATQQGGSSAPTLDLPHLLGVAP